MKPNLKIYFSIMILYFIIDVVYQITIGLRLVSSLYANAGIDGIMNDPPRYVVTIPLFFVVMAYILLKLAVEPALEKANPRLAFFNGALVGIAAYGTLALVWLWTIKGFPPAAAIEFLVEGLLFPTLSSGITAWWFLRDKSISARR